MRDRSRRPRPAGDDPGPPTTTPSSGGSRTARTSTPTTRAARRRTRTVARYEERSLFDRYRGLLLGAFALLGVAVIAFLFLRGTGAQAYTCGELLQPGPTDRPPTPVPQVTPSPAASPTASPPSTSPASSPSPTEAASPQAAETSSPATAETSSPAAGETTSPPATPSPSPTETATEPPGESPSPSPAASPTPTAPTPTQRAGFTTQDLGNEHVRTGSSISYRFCPPTSGDHYNEQGLGPIPRQFYTAEREIRPGGWIHNLEHGWVAALYSCRDGCPTSEEMDELERMWNSVPAPPGQEGCGDNKMIVARFDQMSSKFAMVAWDRALLLDTFDYDQAVAFAEQWMDGPQAPERGIC